MLEARTPGVDPAREAPLDPAEGALEQRLHAPLAWVLGLLLKRVGALAVALVVLLPPGIGARGDGGDEICTSSGRLGDNPKPAPRGPGPPYAGGTAVDANAAGLGVGPEFAGGAGAP